VKRWLLLFLFSCSSVPEAPDAGCLGKAYDRTCAAAADCALLVREVDCCRSVVGQGIARLALAPAQQETQRCETTAPDCGCMPSNPRADDGRPFPEAAAVDVRCTAKRCESYVR